MLKIGNKESSSGHIDFIGFNDMVDPIMWGYDKYNRLFICFKCIYVHEKQSEYKVFIVFQRYSNKDIFMSNLLYPTFMNEKSYSKLKTLILTDECNITTKRHIRLDI